MKALKIGTLACTAAAALLFAVPAHAQQFRAYLSSHGSDQNPCTLASPCRLLPAALAVVADAGEIWMLDSANYNVDPVRITRSVSILAIPGVVGSVLAKAGPAIQIDAPSVIVTLRNLSIGSLPGSGAGDGVLATNGARLHVEGCLIANLLGRGIAVEGPLHVQVLDTVIRDNDLGLSVSGNAEVNLWRVGIHGNTNYGVLVAPVAGTTASLTASEVVSSFNSYGFVVGGGAGRAAKAYVTRSAAEANRYNGFHVASTGVAGDAVLELSQSVATRNDYGLMNLGGLFQSAGDNRSAGNITAASSGPITPTASK